MLQKKTEQTFTYLWLYIDNYYFDIESSKTYHFADNTSIMQPNKSLENLAKHIARISQTFHIGMKCHETDLVKFHPSSLKFTLI